MADGSFLTQQGEEESTPCVPPIGGSLQAARDAARDALSLEYDDPDEPLLTAPARLSSWKTQIGDRDVVRRHAKARVAAARGRHAWPLWSVSGRCARRVDVAVDTHIVPRGRLHLDALICN